MDADAGIAAIEDIPAHGDGEDGDSEEDSEVVEDEDGLSPEHDEPGSQASTPRGPPTPPPNDNVPPTPPPFPPAPDVFDIPDGAFEDPPAQGDDIPPVPGHRRVVQASTHEWGPFRMTWVKPSSGKRYGSWQALCRYHCAEGRRCTKAVSVEAPGDDAAKSKALSFAKHWSVQAAFGKKKKGMCICIYVPFISGTFVLAEVHAQPVDASQFSAAA